MARRGSFTCAMTRRIVGRRVRDDGQWRVGPLLVLVAPLATVPLVAARSADPSRWNCSGRVCRSGRVGSPQSNPFWPPPSAPLFRICGSREIITRRRDLILTRHNRHLHAHGKLNPPPTTWKNCGLERFPETDTNAARSAAAAKRRKCQRAWTFERVAGYEMKIKPRRRLHQLASKELCMDACLLESDFDCRSANWFRQTGDCHLSDQDRHSVSQSEAGDQRLKSTLGRFYGVSNLTLGAPPTGGRLALAAGKLLEKPSLGQLDWARLGVNLARRARLEAKHSTATHGLEDEDYLEPYFAAGTQEAGTVSPANALVDYLENNCVFEPNRLCEFHKIQNKVLKTVDSIYQDVATLEECKQKCLNAPYRCYSFDYGDTSERVCRTSHLDQASLMSVREPYLEVVGAITYELASCFNVSIQCRAKEMVALVSASKVFKGKIYAKSRPSSCVVDVKEALKFELSMRYQDQEDGGSSCDVRASSNEQRGVFSNDIIIQHHDRIVTTQDVGLSVYCHYDLGNRSVATNQVDLAIERLPDGPVDSKQAQDLLAAGIGSAAAHNSPLTITGLATTVVRSPNVTMRITNMNGQPVSSATVGDRLALMFEIKEKSSPFGIFVREVVALDGRQVIASMATNSSKPTIYHYAASTTNNNASLQQISESAVGAALEEQSQQASAIQFIDSNGCPTDSNLMGPLVKMDPHGHKLLAPFDAFKFPTSDMVFFRAVVSSCVAECKPAVCAPLAVEYPSIYSNSASTLGLEPSNGDGNALGAGTTSPMDEDDGDLSASGTRSMLSSAVSSFAASSPALEARTTILSTMLPTSSTTEAPSNVHTTILPGVRPSDERTRGSSVAPPPQIKTDATVAWPQLQQQHSHQHNNDERATTTVARERSSPMQLSGDAQSNGDVLTTVPGFSRSTTGAPATTPSELSSRTTPTTTTERLNKDHGGSEDETSGVNETMSNNHLLGHQLPPRRAQSAAANVMPQMIANLSQPPSGSDGPSSHAATDPLLSEKQRQTISDLLMGSDGSLRAVFLPTMEGNQLEEIEHGGQAKNGSRKATDLLDSLISGLASESSPVIPERPLSQDNNNNRTTIGDLLTKYFELLQRRPSGTTGNESAPVDATNAKQLGHVSRPTRRVSSSVQSSGAGRPRNRDKERHQQALADSYLGALQSMGKRKRKRRQIDGQEEPLGFDFVRLEQPQSGLVNYSLAQGGHDDSMEPLFTHAVVELYPASRADDLHHRGRSKRQAPIVEGGREKQLIQQEQTGDGEELVVQSIKILDRLQFEEEEQQQQRPRATAPATNEMSRADGRKARDESGGSHFAGPITQRTRNSIIKSKLSSGTSANEIDDLGPQEFYSKRPLSAFSLTMLATCFVFLQISMVLVCLVNWKQQERQAKRGRTISQPLSIEADQSMSDSTSSTCHSTTPLSSCMSSSMATNSPKSVCNTSWGSTLDLSCGRRTTNSKQLGVSQSNVFSRFPQQRDLIISASNVVVGRRQERNLLCSQAQATTVKSSRYETRHP